MLGWANEKWKPSLVNEMENPFIDTSNFKQDSNLKTSTAAHAIE